MAQNLHVCTISFRLEVVVDVISGRNVNTLESYLVVYFEVDSSDSFRDIKKNHFVTAEADIDDSIKRKRFCVSLKKLSVYKYYTRIVPVLQPVWE